MSKLFKLKDWLTLEEAAKHISSAIGEEVLIKDIYRLALDKHLTLSVNLVNHAQAKRGDLVGPEDVRLGGEPAPWFSEALEKAAIENENGTKIAYDEIVLSLSIGDGLFLILDEKVTSIEGVWDLPLWGNEHLDVQHKYQQMIGGPVVSLVCIEGTYVRRGDVAYELQDDFDDNEFHKGSKARQKNLEKLIIKENISEDKADKVRDNFNEERKQYLEERKNQPKEHNYYPAGGLPSDAVIVMRTEEVLRFLSSLEDVDKTESVGKKELNTLLLIIAALCKEAKIDHQARGIASVLEKLTEINGARVSDDTIRDILKKVRDAMDSRSQ